MKTFLFILILFFSLPAAASDGVPHSVQKAEDYLQSLETAKARFVLTGGDGAQYTGTFYLNRPGKLRFEYDEPLEDFIVADGLFIYFYDAELGEQSNAPIGQTLADFLLRKDLELSGDIIVRDVRRGGGLLQIEMVHSDDPESGSITLGFKENPMEIKKWRVTDAAGGLVEIELFGLETGLELDSDLFIYRDPDAIAGQSFNE